MIQACIFIMLSVLEGTQRVPPTCTINTSRTRQAVFPHFDQPVPPPGDDEAPVWTQLQPVQRGPFRGRGLRLPRGGSPCGEDKLVTQQHCGPQHTHWVNKMGQQNGSTTNWSINTHWSTHWSTNTQWWYTVVVHSGGTHWWDTVVGHSGGTHWVKKRPLAHLWTHKKVVKLQHPPRPTYRRGRRGPGAALAGSPLTSPRWRRRNGPTARRRWSRPVRCWWKAREHSNGFNQSPCT